MFSPLVVAPGSKQSISINTSITHQRATTTLTQETGRRRAGEHAEASTTIADHRHQEEQREREQEQERAPAARTGDHAAAAFSILPQ